MCISVAVNCQQSLGMEDGYIEDFQISSWSETDVNPIKKGRLGDTGWCTEEPTIKFESAHSFIVIISLLTLKTRNYKQ